MSITIQYLIVGIITGICIAIAARAIYRTIRRPSSSRCANCSTTDCPLRKK